jgi:hypothetical protein
MPRRDEACRAPGPSGTAPAAKARTEKRHGGRRWRGRTGSMGQPARRPDGTHARPGPLRSDRARPSSEACGSRDARSVTGSVTGWLPKTSGSPASSGRGKKKAPGLNDGPGLCVYGILKLPRPLRPPPPGRAAERERQKVTATVVTGFAGTARGRRRAAAPRRTGGSVGEPKSGGAGRGQRAGAAGLKAGEEKCRELKAEGPEPGAVRPEVLRRPAGVSGYAKPIAESGPTAPGEAAKPAKPYGTRFLWGKETPWTPPGRRGKPTFA